MSDNRPTHLSLVAGDRYSACGIKDALPRCTVKAAPMHIAGYGMPVCEACVLVVVSALMVLPIASANHLLADWRWVRDHDRGNGTKVRGHWRKRVTR